MTIFQFWIENILQKFNLDYKPQQHAHFHLF